MILEYHRPQTVEEAVELLNRESPHTLPLGGGSTLSSPRKSEYAVVDLQKLPLNQIVKQGNYLKVGATVLLQELMGSPDIPGALRDAIHQEANFNQRQVGTVAGTLITATGRSTFTTAMMALDTRLLWLPGSTETGIGDWLPLRAEALPGKLITQATIQLQAKLAFQSVARTPEDLPIVCVAAARWPSGRTRIVLGGYGNSPIMALDGTEATGAGMAARNAYSNAGDEWASSEYRGDIAEILTRRCVMLLEEG